MNYKISAETLGMEGECVGMVPERKSSWLDVDSIGKSVRSPSPGPEDWRRKSISRYCIIRSVLFLINRK